MRDAGDAALGLDAALGSIAVSPLALGRAYVRLAASERAADRQVIAALTHHGQAELAWETGTSSGRRDAWSVGITATHVIVVWLGNLSGRGAPNLLGRTATHLLHQLTHTEPGTFFSLRHASRRP
ncbi:MAG: hypothetical protein HYR85_05885 [Planctomycetes bacterium]|nr:hypothetical protein [Planctomycetota bacterium]MBI3846605.1 hypothetical protein [Planctomycetota bacterium]